MIVYNQMAWHISDNKMLDVFLDRIITLHS